MANRRRTRSKTTAQLRITHKEAAGLTDHRKSSLQEDIERGILQENQNYVRSGLNNRQEITATDYNRTINRNAWFDTTTNRSYVQPDSQAAVGAVVHSESHIREKAIKQDQLMKVGSCCDSTGSSGTSGSSTSASIDYIGPEVYSPLYTMANLNLPRDRVTVNAWIRAFFQLHPIVRNAITLHATYPISKLNLKCHDKKVLQFHEDMVEDMGLMESLGDVSMEYWKLGECVSGNNHLIVSGSTLKRVDQVKIGDKVLTHTGKYQRVVERLVNWNHKEYLSIQTQGSPETIDISANHPIYAAQVGDLDRKHRRSKIADSIPFFENEDKWDFKWVKAESLVENDICVIPVDRRVEDNEEIPDYLCRVIGIYLSEGCINYGIKHYNKDNIPKCVVISNGDSKLWEYYRNFFSKCGLRLVLFGMNGYLRSSVEKSETSKFAQKMKKYASEYSINKQLSNEIMLLPPKKQLEIINGFIDGDGWIHRGRICMATISKDLAFQIRTILARNYITCSINKHIANRKNGIYFVEIPLFYANRFNLSPTKQKLLDSEKANRKLKPNNVPRIKFSINGHLLCPIKKITKHKLQDGCPLYNFEVENDNSYCIYGLSVHNCFPYAELNENSGKWSKIVIQNPDFVNIRKTILSNEPIVTLRPDAVLQRLVSSNNPADVQLRRQIPEDILYYVRNGQDIPLNNFNISHLKMLASPYDIRGTSILVSVFKELILWDKIREAKFAQADGMINPITIVKVGGNEDGEYRATQADIDFFRDAIEQAQYDKDFKLITHAGIKIERIGFTGQVLDIAGDLEFITKNIYTGLMVPPAIVDTESAAYSSASIGLEVLRQRYFNFRNMMARWLVNKIFVPISEIQGFYEYKDKEKHLIVPEIEWNQMNLYDLQDYISNITGMVSAGQASIQTLYRSLGLSYQDEQVKMRQEAIDKAIRMREENALASMTLTELRTLDPEKPITEPTDSKDRGKEAPAEAGMPAGMPGAEMGLPGEMPGAPGGLPELAPPPGGEMGGEIPGAPAPEGGVTPPLGPGAGPMGPGM